MVTVCRSDENELEKNFLLARFASHVQHCLNHTHKTGSWYLLEFLFKISDQQPCLFYIGVPSWGQVCIGVR